MSNTYVVLSSKEWNKDLPDRLKLKFPEKNFILIDKKEDFTPERLREIDPVKVLIPHWSYIISPEIFENFTCVVFHMTDLPYGRGGSPLQNLIVRGHEKTKVSAIKVVEELDGGDVYLKSDLSLLGTAEEVFIRLNSVVEKMVEDIIEKDLQPVAQEGQATVFKRRTKEMSNIENVDNLEELFDYIRMLDAEGYPNAFLETDKFRLEFSRASLKSNKSILADVRIVKK